MEPFNTLSSREFDVFCMLAEDFALQDIAEQLGISRKTVSNCQTSLKLKLGLQGRPTMKKFAESHGLISG
nr:LuxR C-terminal-related transcriptional regulator [Methylomonas sp. SURF-1]